MKVSKKIAVGILFLVFMHPLFAQTTGTLSFSCSTYAPEADYGTKHVAAIWIEYNDNPSVFIKTNAKYGYEDDHLTAWTEASSKNLVDAVTGGTLKSYATLSVEWDGTDIFHEVVPDGDYSIYIEMGWGANHTVDHAVSMYTFTKGPDAQDLTPEGNTNFSSVSLSWQPTASLLSSIKNNEGIFVFPNPAKGVIKMDFGKELTNVMINVTDLTGKILHSEKYNQILSGIKTVNLSEIPAGVYILTVNSKETYFTYKILLED